MKQKEIIEHYNKIEKENTELKQQINMYQIEKMTRLQKELKQPKRIITKIIATINIIIGIIGFILMSQNINIGLFTLYNLIIGMTLATIIIIEKEFYSLKRQFV